MKLEFRTEPPPVDQCWNLFVSTGWNAEYQITAGQYAGAVAGSWCTISVYDGDQLVGFGRVVGDGLLYGMIHDLIVDPAYQHKGIGGDILDRLVERCVGAGISGIQLFSSRGNRSFYEKRGFVARPDDGPGMQYQHGTRNAEK